MTTRFLIALVAAALALHAPRLTAQSPGPDSFIPNQPQKPGADPHASESRAVKYTLLLPNEKSSETVKDADRNPFGKGDDEMKDAGGKSSNEETKIQEQLAKLHATGLSPGPNGLRVLLGDMWLSKKDIMPAVVKDQTLALQVNEVTREAIQLVWMEKKFTGLPPRLLVIPVDLRPTVRRVPHGQLAEKSETKVESRASKRATAVELPAPIAAQTDPAEARKISQLALAPMSPPAPETPAAKEDAVIIAATPGKLPFLNKEVSAPQVKQDPAPSTNATSAPPTEPQVATRPEAPAASGPPVPAANPPLLSEAPASPKPSAPAAPPLKTATSDPEIAGPPAPRAESTEPQVATKPDAPAANGPPATPATEPAAWKHAMGLIDNLVKLSEANK